MKKIIFSRKIFILVLTAIVTIAIISFFLAPKKILKTDSLIDNTSVHYDFSSREMCEKQTGWPCRATMCSEDGSGVCNNFIKGRSWGPVLPEYDLYEVEEVLRSDKLQYRGSASVANRYLIKGILVSKQYADCSTCLSLDPSLCSPCPNGKIILASVSYPNQRLIVDIKPSNVIQDIVQKLVLNQYYELQLQPGQNHPELIPETLR